jgi:methionine synthase II (cobalamin-independent)
LARGRQLRRGGGAAVQRLGFYFLEYDSPRAGGFTPLRFVPKHKSVVLGLVSSKVPELEEAAVLKRGLDQATKFVALDRLAVSPQCGFASLDSGNPLTIEAQNRKLGTGLRFGA